MTSKDETTNSPIHEFKVSHEGQIASQNPCLVVYCFLFINLKNILSLHELVNSWFRFFDVTNKLKIGLNTKLRNQRLPKHEIFYHRGSKSAETLKTLEISISRHDFLILL